MTCCDTVTLHYVTRTNDIDKVQVACGPHDSRYIDLGWINVPSIYIRNVYCLLVRIYWGQLTCTEFGILVLEKYGRHIADGVLKCIFLSEDVLMFNSYFIEVCPRAISIIRKHSFMWWLGAWAVISIIIGSGDESCPHFVPSQCLNYITTVPILGPCGQT